MVADKTEQLEMLLQEAYAQNRKLIDALRPFARAAQVVEPSWVTLSGQAGGPGQYIVLSYDHLQEADATLHGIGLYKPYYRSSQN